MWNQSGAEWLTRVSLPNSTRVSVRTGAGAAQQTQVCEVWVHASPHACPNTRRGRWF